MSRRDERRCLALGALLLGAAALGACSSDGDGTALREQVGDDEGTGDVLLIANPCGRDKAVELYRGDTETETGAPAGAPSATATIERESIASVPRNDLSFDDEVWTLYIPFEGGGGGASLLVTPGEVVNDTLLITAFFCG